MFSENLTQDNDDSEDEDTGQFTNQQGPVLRKLDSDFFKSRRKA